MKATRHHIFLVLCISLVTGFRSLAQTHIIDSLQNKIKSSKDDSVTVLLFTALANEYSTYDTVKSKQYLQQGATLAKKIKWDYALGDNYFVKGIIDALSTRYDLSVMDTDTAITYFQKVINSSRPKKEVSDAKLYIATCLGQKADILAKRGEEAIPVYIAALEAWKASDDPRKNQAIGTYYGRISSLYFNLNQFDKALTYDKLSLSSMLLCNNEEAIAWAHIYVCDDFAALNQLDSSIAHLAKAKLTVEKLNNHALNIQYYNKLAQMSRKKTDFRKAIFYYEKVIAEAKIINSNLQTLSARKMIAICYSKLGEYSTARQYLLMALPAALNDPHIYIKEPIEILQELVTVEEKTNNKSQAFIYLKQLTTIKDSANTESSKRSIAEIENKYQAAEKEKKIVQLNAEKEIQSLSIKQKSTLNYFLIAFLTALLIVGFLGYRNIRNRQQLAKQQDELHQQRIRELEKDQQLVAVDSMLKGQEDERSRLAKDLHDGLGGLLSGVKFSLINMKDNLIITPDNMAVFERSLDMIDTSIKELRRVAHNMMPE
ncbi:MAG: histidine kinase, partial [Chitinophagaceae bacterium]